MVDVIVVLQVYSLHSLATPFLGTVRGDRQSLHIAGLSHRDHHVLVGNQVLDVDLGRFFPNGRLSRRAEPFLDFEQLVLDDLVQKPSVVEHALVVRNLLAKLHQLVLDLLPFQADQPTKPHLQDRLGLLVREAEALSQSLSCLLIRLGRPDDRNHLVDVVQGDDVAFQDMFAFLGLCELVARTALDDVFLMKDVVVEHLLEREYARHTINQGQHYDTEADLKLCVLEQLVDDDLRHRVLLELDDDVDAMSIGAVVDV